MIFGESGGLALNHPFCMFGFSIINPVGGLNPSEKYEFVSWDYDIPNIIIYGKS